MKYLNLCLIFFLVFFQSSCEHKNIYNNLTTNIEVVFDWSKSPKATPKAMAVFFYSKSDNEVIRYDFSGNKGGVVRLPLGEYKAFCLNTDTEGMVYHNVQKIYEFEIASRETDLSEGLSSLISKDHSIPKGKGTEGESVVMPASNIWTDTSDYINISELDKTEKIVFSPMIRTSHYTVDIFNVKNLMYNTSLAASLSTLSRGFMPGSEKYSKESVTIPFEIKNNLKNENVNGEFKGFGCIPDTDHKHILMIYAILGDGRKWYYSFDVSSQIYNAEDPWNIHIVLDSLVLPQSVTNGSGFRPEVTEWEEVLVNIEM